MTTLPLHIIAYSKMRATSDTRNEILWHGNSKNEVEKML
jgi:hypothetical protein